ncbi:hypothetical protein [Achromobacter ruhlandii]|uniref:Uncharacterized protein n=1 Tax=Achromobacter ruhlandii TaxID=72557 RepID=A0ABM8LPT4_9BURK|nr:hypothetical protein [Achromobacter ruhlandii]AKP88700.1 hypothetical protein Axylo_1180 [Achromobacter xylosoxidans]AMG43259.1 hypothetical protein AL520_00090 [Achromobacter xylosoxidans]AOU95793.1 uncharacterized protein AruCF_4902 [Achromobacter ruhlandii]MCZ8431684.1 hypothetical protein [Achromobacter ruhlandii]MDC6090325.1 hypothetical protein [Achromobacter ruhlandii]
MEKAFEEMRKFSRDMHAYEIERAALRRPGQTPDLPDGPLIPLRLLLPMLLAWTLGVGGILCFLP